MTDNAKMSMILCSGLEPAEQERVERLHTGIFERFKHAGHVVRTCLARIDGDRRLLEFSGPAGVVATVSAIEFLAASDTAAVALTMP